jgi:hypothetical protein
MGMADGSVRFMKETIQTWGPGPAGDAYPVAGWWYSNSPNTYYLNGAFGVLGPAAPSVPVLQALSSSGNGETISADTY